MNTAGIKSCGQTLLQGAEHTFDYVLHLTDGKQQATLFCHRAVLAAHSKKLDAAINAENYFDQEIQVLPGYLGAMIELIQFMYLKDQSLITQCGRIKKLCVFLDVPLDLFRLVEKDFSVRSSPVVFQFEKDPENRCVVSQDLFRHLKIYHSKLSTPEEALGAETAMQDQALLEQEERLIDLQNKLELWEEDIKTRERSLFQKEQTFQDKIQDYESRLKVLQCRETQMEKQMSSLEHARQELITKTPPQATLIKPMRTSSSATANKKRRRTPVETSSTPSRPRRNGVNY